jgi:hypothetical protein
MLMTSIMHAIGSAVFKLAPVQWSKQRRLQPTLEVLAGMLRWNVSFVGGTDLSRCIPPVGFEDAICPRWWEKQNGAPGGIRATGTPIYSKG